MIKETPNLILLAVVLSINRAREGNGKKLETKRILVFCMINELLKEEGRKKDLAVACNFDILIGFAEPEVAMARKDILRIWDHHQSISLKISV